MAKKSVKRPQKIKARQRNIDHIAHQVGVTGVGAHKNKKAYSRKQKHKERY